MHPATDNVSFGQVNFRDGGSVLMMLLKQQHILDAYHVEADNDAGSNYVASQDLAQSTAGVQTLAQDSNIEMVMMKVL